MSYGERSQGQQERMRERYRRQDFGVGDATVFDVNDKAVQCSRCGGSGLIEDFEYQVVLACAGLLTRTGWCLPVTCPACKGRG